MYNDEEFSHGGRLHFWKQINVQYMPIYMYVCIYMQDCLLNFLTNQKNYIKYKFEYMSIVQIIGRGDHSDDVSQTKFQISNMINFVLQS